MEMEAGGPSSKRSRSVSPGEDEDRGGVDRISDLPDAVLGDIITLLPIKDGARTGILASRWRHIWRSAPLNLDCSRLGCRFHDRAGVISSILSSHQGPGGRFCINAGSIPIPREPANTQSSLVDAWLRSPALDNLRELSVGYTIEDPFRPLSPSILRFSATLRVFSVGRCNLCDSTELHFPMLQELTLRDVGISESSLNHMIARCPALESLIIHGCFGFQCVRINSTSLTSIDVVAECRPTKKLPFEKLIIEHAPFLKRLMHLDGSHGSTELHISVLSALKLDTLRCILNKNRLSTKLSFGSTIIQGFYVDSLTVAVPTVKTLDVALDHLSLDIVINLLRCFPCLEKLYIKVVPPYRTSAKNLWRHKYRNLARCLDIRLKTIMLTSYRGYRGTMSEVNFFRFFLLNAKGLESVTIVVSDINEEFIAKLSRKLQLENGASRGVRFNFTTLVRLCLDGLILQL